jgi:hypothetical protein
MDANDLINTKTVAPGTFAALQNTWTSFDYYDMRPYPKHAFGSQQWPLDKGPVPTALPYVKVLVDESAEFTFRGGPPSFTVSENDAANDFLAEVIKRNSLNTRWVSLARRAGNLGTIAVKWSYDADDPRCPVRLAFLSVPEECRVWCDPHDLTRILLARVQYPYRDPNDGRWYYYREEWTDALWVTYKPKFAGESSVQTVAELAGYTASLGDGEGWEIDQQETNAFGVIPVALIKNRAVEGQLLGEGDCWRSFKLIDRIALTMHGEDRSNQMHSEPIPVTTNARLNNDGPLLPGEPISVENQNKEGPPADMKLLEPHGQAREFSHRTMDRWEELLYAQCGMSRIDPATVTNKGNMTRAVFTMLYGRTIATSDHKRTAWGEGGLGPFFSNMLTGLANVGGVRIGDIALPSVDLPDVTVNWPDYFDATDDDLSALTDRTTKQVSAGLLTKPRGARRVALAEGHPPHEVEEIADEAGKETPAPSQDVTVAPLARADVADLQPDMVNL